MIPLVDLKAQYAQLRAQIDAAIQRVLDSTAFVLGEEVRAFEEAFAGYCDVPHAVGVASGTAALHLALLACDVGSGDEVITTTFTFIATAEAISHTGAHPVFVDIDPLTYNIDPAAVEARIGPRTKAIVAVHLYGAPADMEALGSVARRHGLALIEDAAQAHGARSRGRRVGSIGTAGCFSFYPGKNLGGYGDGGMVVTRDAAVAARIRMLRDHGRREKYAHEIIGYGERLDALQAAVLGVKLTHLDEWNMRRRRAAARYCELLAEGPAQLPHTDAHCEAVYHLFVVRVRGRDRVLQQLRAAQIGAAIHYPTPIHLQPAYAHFGHRAGSFPRAERAAAEVLSLPLYPEITETQLIEVANAVRGTLGGGA